MLQTARIERVSRHKRASYADVRLAKLPTISASTSTSCDGLSSRRMRFLFALRNGDVLRVFDAPIRRLCEGGDEVLALLEAPSQLAGLSRRLEAELDGLTIRPGVELRGAKVELDEALRVWIDYLRYLEPDLEGAMKYKERCGRPLPAALREDTDWAAGESPELRRALAAGLRAIERSLPVPDEVMRLLERERPDAVLVSPLLKRGSPQVAYLRAARRLGIPSALCVASWDNLTSTGVIHEVPDLVTVWNDAQREEAVRLHGVPPDRVAVTGAPRFDEWFDRSPTASHEEYCRKLGLPADRPHILYVGSHKFAAPDEAEWISHWLSSLRGSGHPELEDVPVVVRPHPDGTLHEGPGGAGLLARERDVVVHPPGGAAVVDEASLSEYFDSIYHAAAVVGINTSAMIEAAVVGRGIHVLLAKRYRSTQQDSPHFDYLRTVGGGLVVATKSREEHARGLARALRGEDAEEAAERARSFLAAFIRPHGLDRPATPIMVDALRALAAEPGVASEPEMGDLADVLRPLLVPERPKREIRKARTRGSEPDYPSAERVVDPRANS